MKKTVSFMLVAAIILLWSNTLAKDRPGAAVVLALKDGRMLKGELYAVKADAVIIVDAQSESMTVAVTDIGRIELKKRIGRSIRTGAIIGSVAVAGLGLAAFATNSDGGGIQANDVAAISGIILLGGAVPGGFIGWVAGGASSTKTFRIEGLSGEPLRKVLSKLSKYARASALR
ncbi:MAG: hypothetical protein NT147_01470 [Candidatus Aminicenantes bacterium]|nr:hypothetical protein [Candidatus Aminicenantes bacterium]